MLDGVTAPRSRSWSTTAPTRCASAIPQPSAPRSAAMNNTAARQPHRPDANLGSLATMTELPGQTEILQDNQQRYVAVTARLEGLDLGHGIAAVQDDAGQAAPAALDPRRIRRPLQDAAEIVPRPADGAGPGGRLRFPGAAFRIPEFLRADRDSGFGGAFHGGRLLRAAAHRHHLQPVLVHGADHGDRHRGEERHPAARRRREIPRRGLLAPKNPSSRRDGAGCGPS